MRGGCNQEGELLVPSPSNGAGCQLMPKLPCRRGDQDVMAGCDWLDVLEQSLGDGKSILYMSQLWYLVFILIIFW